MKYRDTVYSWLHKPRGSIREFNRVPLAALPFLPIGLVAILSRRPISEPWPFATLYLISLASWVYLLLWIRRPRRPRT